MSTDASDLIRSENTGVTDGSLNSTVGEVLLELHFKLLLDPLSLVFI